MENEVSCFLGSVASKPSRVLVVPCGHRCAFKRKIVWTNFENCWFNVLAELEAEFWAAASRSWRYFQNTEWELLSGANGDTPVAVMSTMRPEDDAQKTSKAF